jgi:transposase
LDGKTRALFCDVTTLYFETQKETDLRKTGFSKNGKHSNPQVILGLLMSIDRYSLACSIHEGNTYERHTMLPVVKEFVTKHNLDNFVVIADSDLINDNNIAELERLGYKYIINAKIKNPPSLSLYTQTNRDTYCDLFRVPVIIVNGLLPAIIICDRTTIFKH